MQNKYEVVWGIDISKEWLDISIDHQVTRVPACAGMTGF